MTKPIFSNHGCRLNMYETEAMKKLASNADLSNAVIINTCAVTAEAVRKAKQDIRKLHRKNPNSRIIVTGCAAQIEPLTFSKMSEVDSVIGNSEKMQASTWTGLANSFDTEPVQVDEIMSVTETAGHLIDGFGTRSRAYVQVQNGCDHRCTFCIIPYGRGNSRSVPAGVVVDQIKLGDPDESGRRKPQVQEGSSYEINADMVIKALGFDPEDLPKMFEANELQVTKWGTIKADFDTMETNIKGVFAAGDIIRGASLVVWAIKDGRDAATSIKNYLENKFLKERRVA